MEMTHCHRCDQLPTTKNKTLGIYLCDACSNEKCYELITKTNAKLDYFLTDDDLQTIDPSRQYTRQHYYYRCVVTLYHVTDVETVFANKHGVIDVNNKLDQLKQEKKKKRDNRVAKKQQQINKRKQALINGLTTVKLELRSDSQLCEGFIDGSIKTHTLDQVVQRMCQMKYLFDYCHMDAHLQNAYESQQDERESGYYPDRTVFEQAEDNALHQCGGYPQQWPWLL